MCINVNTTDTVHVRINKTNSHKLTLAVIDSTVCASSKHTLHQFIASKGLGG